MQDIPQYLLVDSRALPEVFLKVVEAKRLLAQGKAANLSQAVKLAGISRSAFYKYKDCVHAYRGEDTRGIATLYCELCDEAGVLSSLLSELYRAGANIITINQNIPIDGVAPVTVSMRMGGGGSREDLLLEIRTLPGVVAARIL
ncbi:MAG: ACT domain-containing protein [Oscillospiraceae bacterium]|nr:ACT domain-containing protein [Oscillospiraceae bacterium]